MEKKEKQHFFPFIPHKGKKYYIFAHKNLVICM